jgi:hypothetical protein
MTKAGIKYAALLFDSQTYPEKDSAPRHLASDIITWRGQLANYIDADEVKHWREWIGSMEWDALMGEQRIVLAFMPSDRPEVLDHESKLLEQRLGVARKAYILASPSTGCDAEFRYIGGQATSIEPDIRLKSIREHGDFHTVVRPFYRTREAFTNVWPWRDMYSESWLDRMAEWVEILSNAYAKDDQAQKLGMPVLLDLALAAFDTALQRSRLEFRIPEFARAADCILATRQGHGKRDFIDRSLQLVPSLLTHWYVGGARAELEQRIGQLYDHRSECVHGKVPFLQLHKRGEAGADDAARFEFLAEAIARGLVDFVLRRPAKFPILRDRALLDTAWANGSFPI